MAERNTDFMSYSAYKFHAKIIIVKGCLGFHTNDMIFYKEGGKGIKYEIKFSGGGQIISKIFESEGELWCEIRA